MWVDSDATLVGICMQDTVATVAARSFDFFKSFDANNNIRLEQQDVTEIRSTEPGQEISVYGTTFRFEEDYLRWSITADLVSGESEAPDVVYYAYVTDLGETKLTEIAPHDRRADLRGFYHPNKALALCWPGKE